MNFAPGAWRYAIVPLVAAPFALLISAAAGVATLALGVGTLAFFRDPDRSPPPTGVVSPADGKVSVLRPEGDRVRLGVFMNVWNVHVARAPFAGTVDEVAHSPGAHKPAFSKDSDRNEKVHVRFAGDAEASAQESADEEASVQGTATEDARVQGPADEASLDREVTLIAGAFARRIHPYVEAGDDLERGERLGHIAFGSRVDVLFPPSVDRDDVAVEVGESVTAGETVILESRPGAGPAPFDIESDVDPDGTTVLDEESGGDDEQLEGGDAVA